MLAESCSKKLHVLLSVTGIWFPHLDSLLHCCLVAAGFISFADDEISYVEIQDFIVDRKAGENLLGHFRDTVFYYVMGKFSGGDLQSH